MKSCAVQKARAHEHLGLLKRCASDPHKVLIVDGRLVLLHQAFGQRLFGRHGK